VALPKPEAVILHQRPSDPETGPLVNPTYTGKLKLSAPILIGKFSLDALIALAWRAGRIEIAARWLGA